jgi:signal transduction histidine kinase
VTSQLLGIVNESLSNVARHSGATRAWIDVTGDERGLTISVRDNGHGFEPGSVAALGHQGLRNMRSRAADIGAMMDITSTPQGTEVRVRLEQDPTARGVTE